jgi:hypothetical protein
VLRTPRARTAGVYFCFQQEYTPFSLPRALTTTLFMLPQPALLLCSILFIIRSCWLLPPPHYTSFRSYRHLASAVTFLFTRPSGLKQLATLKQLKKPRGSSALRSASLFLSVVGCLPTATSGFLVVLSWFPCV